MSKTNVEVFSGFPIIDNEFDMVCVDAIKVQEGSETFFTPVIRYCIRNIPKQSVDGGFTLLTGFTSDSLVGISVFIGRLVSSGLFVVDVSALGTVYTENWEEIEEVNWNHLSSLYSPPDEELKPDTRVLH